MGACSSRTTPRVTDRSTSSSVDSGYFRGRYTPRNTVEITRGLEITRSEITGQSPVNPIASRRQQQQHLQETQTTPSHFNQLSSIPFPSHTVPPRPSTKTSKILVNETESKVVSPVTTSCLCLNNVLDEIHTQKGFPLLDVTTTILDVVAFKIQFYGYQKGPTKDLLRRKSVSNSMDFKADKKKILCCSSTHTLSNGTRIYSYEKLRSGVRHAVQNKDINSIKFFLTLAKDNEIKDLCDILCKGNLDLKIRKTIEESLKRKFYRKYRHKFRILKLCLGNKVSNVEEFKYQHSFTENSSFDTVVVNVEEDTPRVTDGSICGFHLVILSKNDYNTEAYRLLPYESQEPTEISMMLLSDNRISDLMNNHSNITLINASSIRSKGYNTKDFQIERTPTIVIYCQVKGVIPLGERTFPQDINGFTVDVREGICGFAGDEIRLSEHISAEGCLKSGTLGGFIDLQPHKAFLTCAHVVLPTNVLKNNTAYEYAQRREINIFDKDLREIGRLKKAVFNHGQASSVSVDAAVVEITDTRTYPPDGNFADVFSDNQLNGAGFSRAQELHFSNGQIEQISTSNLRKQVIKVGASSGITLGWLRMGRSCARIIDDYDVHIDESFQIRLFGQLEVMPRIDPSQPSDSQQPFVSDGDSGALVFAICNENPIVLKCVGIVVAKTSYGACLMTPIDKVLDALDLPYNCFSKFSIPSSHQQTDSEELRGLLTSITQQLTVMQSNMATKNDIQNTNENIGNLKSDLEKFNDRLTTAEEEIQKTRAAVNEYGQ